MADTKTSAETRLTALSGGDLVRVSEAQGTSPETYQSKATTAEVMGHQFRGARVHLTANETGVDASSADFPIPWDAAPIDTDGFWSGGSPTRLTIPAGLGITHVELVGSVSITGATSEYTNLVIRQRNSGGTLLLAAGSVEGALGAKLLNVATGLVAVSDGDYFTLDIKTTTDTSITLQAATYFTSLALRVVGMAPV